MESPKSAWPPGSRTPADSILSRARAGQVLSRRTCEPIRCPGGARRCDGAGCLRAALGQGGCGVGVGLVEADGPRLLETKKVGKCIQREAEGTGETEGNRGKQKEGRGMIRQTWGSLSQG